MQPRILWTPGKGKHGSLGAALESLIGALVTQATPKLRNGEYIDRITQCETCESVRLHWSGDNTDEWAEHENCVPVGEKARKMMETSTYGKFRK